MGEAVATAVAVGAGHGRLVVREGALLWVPEPGDETEALLGAFGSVPPAEVVDAITTHLAAEDYAVPAFVCLRWAVRITAVVFGDVELRSDDPLAGPLNGKHADTWIEHTMPDLTDAITFESGSVDDDTDLVAGTIPAGGFRVELVGLPDVPDDVTSPFELPTDVTGELVPAVHCQQGHPNPPTTASCRWCGGLVAPGQSPTNVPRPSLGTLVLDDGTVLNLVCEYVFGRRPPMEGPAAPVQLDGAKVSRAHARVVLRGWDVLVEDLGSTNGTYVVGWGGGEPLRIDPEVPVRIEPGATIYVGEVGMRFSPPR